MKRYLILFFAVFLTSCVYTHDYHLRHGIESFRVQNYRESFVLLLPEAREGQPDAMYAVGFMYYYGLGVVENRKKAWYWINRAAVSGQPDAQCAMRILRKGKSLRASRR
jgi:TPR repeat protein